MSTIASATTIGIAPRIRASRRDTAGAWAAPRITIAAPRADRRSASCESSRSVVRESSSPFDTASSRAATAASRSAVNYSNPVSAGDSFSASVTYLRSGYFSLTLSDKTRGWSQTATQRLKSAKLGSAEVIAEAPSSRGGILPLADFGTAAFSGATVNGSLLTNSTPGLDPITKLSASTVSAAPSAFGGEGFTDTWYSQ